MLLREPSWSGEAISDVLNYHIIPLLSWASTRSAVRLVCRSWSLRLKSEKLYCANLADHDDESFHIFLEKVPSVVLNVPKSAVSLGLGARLAASPSLRRLELTCAPPSTPMAVLETLRHSTTLETLVVRGSSQTTRFPAGPFDAITEALVSNRSIKTFKTVGVVFSADSLANLAAGLGSISTLRLRNSTAFTKDYAILFQAVADSPTLTDFALSPFVPNAVGLQNRDLLRTLAKATALTRLEMHTEGFEFHRAESRTLLPEVAATIGSLTNLRFLKFFGAPWTVAFGDALCKLTKLESLSVDELLPSLAQSRELSCNLSRLTSLCLGRLYSDSTLDGLCSFLSQQKRLLSVSVGVRRRTDGLPSLFDAITRNPAVQSLKADFRPYIQERIDSLVLAMTENQAICCLRRLEVWSGAASGPILEKLAKLLQDPLKPIQVCFRDTYVPENEPVFAEFAKALGAAPGLTGLELWQSHDNFPAQTHANLARFVSASSHIRSLVCRAHRFAGSGLPGVPFSEAILVNTSLRKLELYRVALNDETCVSFAAALRENKTLEHLAFVEPTEMSRQRLKIARAILEHPSLTYLRMGSPTTAHLGFSSFTPAESEEFESIRTKLAFSKRITTQKDY